MSGYRPVVKAASAVLIHSPGLVRYGSKPRREIAARPSFIDELKSRLRTFDEAGSYLPNQVFLGTQPPERLYEVERPWFSRRFKPAAADLAPFGSLLEEEKLIALLALSDPFGHVLLLDRFWENVLPLLDRDSLSASLVRGAPSLLSRGQMRIEIEGGQGIPLTIGVDSEPVGWVRHGHTEDSSLSAYVLLENLSCKVSASLAVRELLDRPDLQAEDVDFILSCSEEAIGDRYQRGGGNLAKAIAEFSGCAWSSGVDIKDFCAAPIPAIVIAASLVQSGVFENVIVVGGSSFPKLGMKFLYHLKQGMPVLEDMQAAAAAWIGRDDGKSPVVNLACVGRHPVRSGASLDRQLKALVVDPIERLEWEMGSVDRFVTELHNPDITVPAKGGDVPERSYRMLAAVLASSGKIDRAEVKGFAKRRGVPGYAPTQGHIASAFVYIPHALRALAKGEIRNCFFLARASLFLGQMTHLSDGMSVLLERHS